MLKEQNKSTNEDKKEVTVDENKLKKGMSAIFLSGDFNTDDLAEALTAAINGVEWLLLLWFWWMFTLVNIISYLYHRIYGLTWHRRSKRRPKQYANHPFRRRPPPGSPIAEPPQGGLMSTCVFGSHISSWCCLLSSRQGVPPGPTDRYEIPNSLHFQELIGASPLLTPR